MRCRCCSFRCCGALLVVAIQAALLLVVAGLTLLEVQRAGRPRSLNQSKVSETRIKPVTLSKADLDSYDRKGYVVVREALPRHLVMELYNAVLRRFTMVPTKVDQYQDTFLVRAHAVWLFDDTFADFLLHRDVPIGALASQLLNASEIRFTNEGLNGISDKDRGSVWHFDISGPYKRSPSPRNLPTVRLWIPLGPLDVVADKDGGSLEIVPLDAVYEAEDQNGSCFGIDHMHTVFFTGACSLEPRIVTPNVALGDVVFYSPQVLHQSQLLAEGTRIAYTGSLYDPSRMAEWVEEHSAEDWRDDDEVPGRHLWVHDYLGIATDPQCRDDKSIHFNTYWQSARTHLVSEETSPCQPQVYPGLLPHEVQTVKEGKVLKGTKGGPLTGWVRDKSPILLKVGLLASERLLREAGLVM